MATAQQDNDEWNALNEEQRNCLKWPDFLEYGDTHNVEIHRQHEDSPLGLVTVAVQDPQTKLWYNITKRIRENSPARGKVNLYEWIIAVDGKPIANESLSSLIKNEKEVVCLSLKKAVDPLKKIAKKWGKEKYVTLHLKEKKVAFELAHFYSKEENENVIKDRILVWDVKETAESETSEPLIKGDEILAVDNETVEGKKLAQIFELIYRGHIPGEVDLKIREIERGQYNTEAPESVAIALKFEEPRLQAPDPSTLQGSTNATQLIVAEKEMDENTGREKKIQSEVYQNTSSLNEEPGLCPLPESEPTSKSGKNGLIGKKLSPSRRRSKGSQNGASLSRQISNEGYSGTPETTRKFPTSDKVCSHCVSTSKKLLPDNRDEWPIDKIETGCFEKICKLLDLRGQNKVSLLSALKSFTQTEALLMEQKYTSDGGMGMAKCAVRQWGSSNRSNNVGALKKIVQHTMVRVDVIQEFEKWEEMSVCHGCGVAVNKLFNK